MIDLTPEDVAKLPLFVHDKDGKVPTEEQLVQVAETILEASDKGVLGSWLKIQRESR